MVTCGNDVLTQHFPKLANEVAYNACDGALKTLQCITSVTALLTERLYQL